MGKKGRRFEMQLTNALEANTTDDVHATRPDFSGNSKYAVADVELYAPRSQPVTSDLDVAFIEVKNVSGTSGRRTTVIEGSATEENGYEELTRLIEGTPSWATPLVGVNWSRRELRLFDAVMLHEHLTSADTYGMDEARLTPSKHVSMRKPTLDDAPSATSGRPPWRVVTDACGLSSAFIDDD